jgi:hypothetical protein
MRKFGNLSNDSFNTIKIILCKVSQIKLHAKFPADANVEKQIEHKNIQCKSL